MRVFDANPKVEEALKARGRLWHREAFVHQYPHCWRCHNPVIFLATSQWFIAMDEEVRLTPDATYGTDNDTRGVRLQPDRTLREAALDQIDNHVRWIPAWGHDRIYNMLKSRPDWCISRQRAWGVPIPAVDCTRCGEAVVTPELVERAAAVFEQFGADAWYERDTSEFVPPDLMCPICGGTSFEREMNILDVWFDSGSSHVAVLSVRPELTWPADMYLEGSDQHRGWFQSSLLVGLGTRGRAPYRQVLTHGFLIDMDGKKMSKSLGNTIQPQDVIKQSGADILRLWIAMSDYREEIRVSKEILARVVEAYRKIRNTLRYLLANLYDFDPSKDRLPVDRLEEVDQYILARYANVAEGILSSYDGYDYGTICQTINAFTTGDLSAFYADVSKDRLYTFAATSRERRSAQTAMFMMADGLTRLLAPILSFTADELWRYLPGRDGESVHTSDFPSADELKALHNPVLLERWSRLTALRERVVAQIEPLRKDKQIGSSLQAKVVLTAGDGDLAFLEAYASQLPMLFIVSEVELRASNGSSEPRSDTQVEIGRATGVKCERCWRYVPAVSHDPEWAGLCERCQQAMAGPR
jgi:isoleucyl-tRNA synthetase